MNKKFWKITEAVTGVVSEKKAFLEISQNSHENTCVRVSFFNKVAGLRPKMKYQIFSTEYLLVIKKNWWSKTVSGTVSCTQINFS